MRRFSSGRNGRGNRHVGIVSCRGRSARVLRHEAAGFCSRATGLRLTAAVAFVQFCQRLLGLRQPGADFEEQRQPRNPGGKGKRDSRGRDQAVGDARQVLKEMLHGNREPGVRRTVCVLFKLNWVASRLFAGHRGLPCGQRPPRRQNGLLPQGGSEKLRFGAGGTSVPRPRGRFNYKRPMEYAMAS